ncbi:exonuclease domain-containing protein [Cryobacterium fucosi]|uniref:DNA polymerase III subunit epsilon n=1 Tax=Cryobacterium fucosi TaxID=1259157 RepID=A0A4R9BFN4_9MICO|nr:exonuclease domain-containing protein [Cryobacterium fucosi]TFD83227.1 DNA polymerase III subunit epsilon [Cryobacterium fucosi]
MPVNFTAIDFETANSSGASACSVGLVKVRDGRVVDRVGWFIQPAPGHDSFLEWNIKIHGIRPTDVVGAATWAEQLPDLVAFADGDHLVAHNAGFDLGVIKTSSTVAGLAVPDFTYVCSLQVARRTYQLDSYRLPVAAMAAGFAGFAHHDALADAEACAAIMVHAAGRHDADTLEELARISGVKIGAIGPVATTEMASTHGPMALNQP